MRERNLPDRKTKSEEQVFMNIYSYGDLSFEAPNKEYARHLLKKIGIIVTTRQQKHIKSRRNGKLYKWNKTKTAWIRINNTPFTYPARAGKN